MPSPSGDLKERDTFLFVGIFRGRIRIKREECLSEKVFQVRGKRGEKESPLLPTLKNKTKALQTLQKKKLPAYMTSKKKKRIPSWGVEASKRGPLKPRVPKGDSRGSPGMKSFPELESTHRTQDVGGLLKTLK